MIGLGYDCHRLKLGKGLVIGGVFIQCEYEYISHSDGDVLLHSLCDALLGACGLGDIGEYFPDDDNRFKDMDSSYFVLEIMKILNEKNYQIVNIDCTVILEKPKLKQYKEQIKNNIAKLCNINPNQINIKAKTSEKMGFVGRLEGIEAFTICELKADNV